MTNCQGDLQAIMLLHVTQTDIIVASCQQGQQAMMRHFYKNSHQNEVLSGRFESGDVTETVTKVTSCQRCQQAVMLLHDKETIIKMTSCQGGRQVVML